MKKLIFLILLSVLIACTGPLEEDIDSLENETSTQQTTLNTMQTQIDSLINELNAQNNYIRIGNLQIVWGSGDVNYDDLIITFPVQFLEIPNVTATCVGHVDGTTIFVKDVQEDEALFSSKTSQILPFNYQAIGLWK